MDLITAAIIGALATGMAQVEKSAIFDSYNALKALIRKRLGAQNEAITAIDHLEKNPNSPGWKETLQDEITAARASHDPELLQMANDLLSLVNANPKGRKQIQQAIGDFNIQVQGNKNRIKQR